MECGGLRCQRPGRLESWFHVLVKCLKYTGFAWPALAAAAATTAPPSNGLKLVAQSGQAVWNGVAITSDGRVLVTLPRIANQGGPSLARIDAGRDVVPYPDAAWNGAGDRPAHPAKDGPGAVFVGVTAIREAPDAALWVVDSGVPGFGKPMVHGGARLIRIDPATNQVTRILTVPEQALRQKSLLGEIRFNGTHAYIADSGAPGLLVLDTDTGDIRRVLDQAPALTARRPLTVDGATLRDADKAPIPGGVRLEVSPDGATLYLQPACGPLSRIDTALLDDLKQPDAAVAAGVSFWYDTPAVGGTAIMPDGTLLLTDLEDDSVLALSPERVVSVLVRDPRLHWADAPFLGHDGTLTIPVSQLDRAAPFQHGKQRISFPVLLVAIDAPALIRAAASSASAAQP